MRRREFIALLGSSVAAWPLAARAQQAGKVPTIGFLGATNPSIDSQRVAAFVLRLRELGWIDSRNLAIEYRWSEGRNERYAENAAEFVPAQGRRHCHAGNPRNPRGKASDSGHS